MPTNVTFENTAIADAIAKAARVAPTKGAAHDKASGIVIQVDPTYDEVIVKATNLEVTFEQHVKVVKCKGDKVIWRIPSAILSGIASSLPVGEGKTVDFIDRNDSWIRLTADRLVTKLAVIPPEDYPLRSFLDWSNIIDKDGLKPASDMASKVEQVAWATDPSKPILSGVHLDGNRLVACNAYSLAVIPCEVPISRPVTAPIKTIATLLKQASDVQMGATDKRLLISLDAETKTTSTLLEGDYPTVDNLRVNDYLHMVRFNRANFIETLQRMLHLARQDKLPTLVVKIDGTKLIKELVFDMEVESVGRMMDSIDVASDFEDTFEINFIPSYLFDAVNSSRAEYVEFRFGREGREFSQVEFSDDSGYEVTLMPKRKTT